jgi:antitoxin Xre/MbcA/ParS-like protein
MEAAEMSRAYEPAEAVAEPISLERRADPEVRKRMSGPAMRSFFNIAQQWDLSVEQQRALLGWPGSSTYHKYKSGNVGKLSYDGLTRISLILGIYKALHILYPKLADRWMKLPNSNSLFEGTAPIEFIAKDGSIDSLFKVRRLLDARRGGWN